MQFRSNPVYDRFGNEIFPATQIPLWTMMFSLINILFSAIQVNVFNVYIGQIKDMNDLKKFMNLAWAHFPFFLQSVMFRITAFGFFLVYLNLLAAIPFFFLLISNLIINYYTAATRKIPKSLKQKHIMLSNTDAVHVWLNSFLSICVPTCVVQDMDPTILQDMQQKHKEDVYKGQKEFQKKVMRQQVNVSTTIILLTLLSIFILVNFHDFGSWDNKLHNTEFNIYCAVILVMGLFSFLFAMDINSYDQTCYSAENLRLYL